MSFIRVLTLTDYVMSFAINSVIFAGDLVAHKLRALTHVTIHFDFE